MLDVEALIFLLAYIPSSITIIGVFGYFFCVGVKQCIDLFKD